MAMRRETPERERSGGEETRARAGHSTRGQMSGHSDMLERSCSCDHARAIMLVQTGKRALLLMCFAQLSPTLTGLGVGN